MVFLLKGLLIGFSIAAPVGPIGVLCIRRTISNGRMAGFLSGLGAATADAFYGAIAVFGLTVISTFLITYHVWIQAVGGFFLLYLGIKTLISKSAIESTEVKKSNIGFYGSTFFLTITNPMTILSFVAVFAGLGLANATYNFSVSVLTVLGVFIGSSIWWFILSAGVGLLKNKFNTKGLRIVDVLAGLIIIGFAILALTK